MAEPIPYMGPEAARPWPIGKAVAVVVVILILYVTSIFIPIRTDSGWVCAICASQRKASTWVTGITTSEVITPSALDGWISQNMGGHVHDWQNLSRTGRDLFGGRHRMPHGGAPPVFGLYEPLIPHYVSAASTEELKAFVNTVQSGTDSEQTQVVTHAVELAIEAMEGERTGATRPATRSK